ncbi:nose resistant to fluoxetine protein 6-like [Lingula anatina]|uniref:Nose resistant to fluoxetine protein 6-like n=1 Tax=Lingula anatina TaxID=7574 RepID=A0A1S3JQI0_LINAN|nr:nose resistant to fluoxetine protein 6-like [Lingula anatina]|eukprot:XP_013412610.1 nose resistant to fluoxetine protein 6-like [Lingula anatina]
MLDATGKMGSGMLDGNTRWYGSYSECNKVQASLHYNDSAGFNSSQSFEVKDSFEGQYCTAKFSVPQSLVGHSVSLTLGICVPSGCSGEDIRTIVDNMLNLKMVPVSCKPKELPWTSGAIAALCITGTLLLLVLLATMYDVIDQRLLTSGTAQQVIPCDDTGERVSTVQGDGYSAISPSCNLPAPPREKGIIHKVIIAFSVYTNAAKVLSAKQPSGALNCLNGIRFLSLTWVIWGHTFYDMFGQVKNIAYYEYGLVQRKSMQVVLQATCAVDTFFVMSGLLVTYLAMREMTKGTLRGKLRMLRINWGMYYFHRFWRLTPPYMLVILVYAATCRYWSNGPMWAGESVAKYCRDSWWTNLLYINNVVNTDKMCLGWSWYLANDMQFFVITPFILLPLFWSRIAGAVIMFLLLLGCWISSGFVSAYHEFGPGGMELNTGDIRNYYYHIMYIKPWCRIGPYLVGMATGYVLHVTQCKPKANWVVALVAWAVTIAILAWLVFGLYGHINGHPWNYQVAALYNATSRTLWGACVAWVIYACCTGYGGIVNDILSWNAFVPLSRLTYCAYLVHPIIMSAVYQMKEETIFATDMTMTYYFFGHLVMSYGCAFVVSMVFEAPMLGLEKAIL